MHQYIGKPFKKAKSASNTLHTPLLEPNLRSGPPEPANLFFTKLEDKSHPRDVVPGGLTKGSAAVSESRRGGTLVVATPSKATQTQHFRFNSRVSSCSVHGNSLETAACCADTGGNFRKTGCSCATYVLRFLTHLDEGACHHSVDGVHICVGRRDKNNRSPLVSPSGWEKARRPTNSPSVQLGSTQRSQGSRNKLESKGTPLRLSRKV